MVRTLPTVLFAFVSVACHDAGNGGSRSGPVTDGHANPRQRDSYTEPSVTVASSTPSRDAEHSASLKGTNPNELTFTDVESPVGGEPVRLLLEIDAQDRIVVTALVTRQYHETFTTKPPTYQRFDEREYVPARLFFSGNFEAAMEIDGVTVALPVVNESRVRTQESLGRGIADAITAGRQAILRYATVVDGKGQEAIFDITGLRRELQLTQDRAAAGRGEHAVAGASDADPISIVASALPQPNKYGIQRANLLLIQNPRGEGAFVYVPRFDIAGHERIVLWFVFGQAYALNGPTKTATPTLPWPRDRPLVEWEKTGFTPEASQSFFQNSFRQYENR